MRPMGRRGRKTLEEENLLTKLIEKSINYLYKSFDTFDEKTKVYLAKEFASKSMATQVKHTGNLTFGMKGLIETVQEAETQTAQPQNRVAQHTNN